ncbi:MAG: four helix bundle protein [bacterium]
MQTPRNLQVWHRALELAIETYLLTQLFPREERFGLASQMRRAAVSVGSNIAEGCGRRGDRELIVFLHHALGSLSELEFQLEVAVQIRLAADEPLQSTGERLVEVRRMLVRLIAAVNARTTRVAGTAEVRSE